MATFDSTRSYAYIDLEGLIRVVQGSTLVTKGTWNSGAFYDTNDVVSYQTALYIALRQVSIYPPTAIVDENWSSLVDVTEQGGELTLEYVYLLALQAGTIATTALYTAWTGTALAQQALDQISAGTWLEDGTRVINDWHVDWGTNPGQISASDLPYQPGGVYPTVGAALDALFYVAPSVTSFTNDIGTVELGVTVGTVVLNWAFNKPITSQSIDQGIGALGAAVRTYTQSGTYTTSRTYNLTASDGSNTANGSTSVLFRHKRYWGNSTNTSLTDGQIIALNSEFSTTRVQSRTVSPSGEYVYFAYPAAWGLASFTVNGLLNTDWTLVARSFVNASGYTETYNIYRSNNLLTGTYVIAIS